MSSKGIFKVSEAVALALHSVILLAENGDNALSNGEMAERLSASSNHLSKVLQRLARAGIVRSSRGPGGGFRLDRPAEEVTLLEVYEAIDGPLDTSGCLFDRPVCDGRFCILGGLVQRLEEEARAYLTKTTLHDVALRRGPVRVAKRNKGT